MCLYLPASVVDTGYDGLAQLPFNRLMCEHRLSENGCNVWLASMLIGFSEFIDVAGGENIRSFGNPVRRHTREQSGFPIISHFQRLFSA